MAILDVAILLAIIWGSAYFRAPVWLWTMIVAVTLLLVSVFGKLSIIALAVFWLLFISAALFANLKKYRIKYFTTALIAKLEKRMPAISVTEREAIDAGDVWWEKELFCGRPKWKNLLKIPAPKLRAEEQQFIDNQVETLCGMINDWDILHKERDLPEAVWNYLKTEKFFGMVIPKEYGGHGFSALMHSTVVLKIATRSISAAVDTMVPNSLGPGELILHYGTQEQKNYYLPRLARGEEIPCFALTSPEAGSDAGAMVDTGVVCKGTYDGKEVLGFRLTWDKRYITLAPVATVLGLAFRLFDPEHLLGDKDDIGITLCLLPTSHPGVQIGHRHWPLNLAFMNGPTRGKDVFVPLEWIIGGAEKAGQGWRMLMECLSIGRGISLPALSTACGKLSYRSTGAYSYIRKQFNTSIANFEGVVESLGYIAGHTYQLEATRMMTAGAVDLKIRPAITSAIAKYHMTEKARRIIEHAMDIHGGHGIQLGPRNILGPAYLAMPVSITVEGANILTRNLIIFGQGAIRCHPYVLDEVELFASTDAGRNEKLDKILLSHVGYFISNMARTFWMGLTGGFLLFAPVRGATAKYYRKLTRMSSALALFADTSMMLLGGDLKRKERLSARLGDILSELYLASTVLKYYQDQGKPESDLTSVRWCLETSLNNIQIACDEIFDNFPVRIVGGILRFLSFPFGRAYLKPRDTLHQAIAAQMIVPSEFRDRLTQYCYIGNSPDDPVRRADRVMDKQIELDELLKKFQKSLRNGSVSIQGDYNERIGAAFEAGVITKEEASALREFEALQHEVIKVNEFSFDLNTIIT